MWTMEHGMWTMEHADLVARVAAGSDEHGEEGDDDAVRRDELLEVGQDERRATLEEERHVWKLPYFGVSE